MRTCTTGSKSQKATRMELQLGKVSVSRKRDTRQSDVGETGELMQSCDSIRLEVGKVLAGEVQQFHCSNATE